MSLILLSSVTVALEFHVPLICNCQAKDSFPWAGYFSATKATHVFKTSVCMGKQKSLCYFILFFFSKNTPLL